MSLLCMDLFCDFDKNTNTPNPQFDEIKLIVYGYKKSVDDDNTIWGIILNKENNLTSNEYFKNTYNSLKGDSIVYFAKNEKDLIKKFENEVVKKLDPDILLCYDAWMKSYGYLIDRCFAIGIKNILFKLSRIKKFEQKSDINFGQILCLTGEKMFKTYMGKNIHISGRTFILLWNLISIKYGVLHSYSLEYIIYYVLNTQFPIYSRLKLISWWYSNDLFINYRVCNYLKLGINMIFKLIQKMNIINEATEGSRLTGLPLMASLTRGSQIRIISLIMHFLKCENLILPSPTQLQVREMKAPMHIPFIIEPISEYYTDPVIVLDFQSLYPSIIIAYNLCYSTCIGSIQNISKALQDESLFYKLGYMNGQKLDLQNINKLLKNNQIFVSPNGIAFIKFLKSTNSEGVLPKILKMILKTRQLVKLSIKKNSDLKLNRILESRQMALKMILNLTYGLTAANFTGHLPFVEVIR